MILTPVSTILVMLLCAAFSSAQSLRPQSAPQNCSIEGQIIDAVNGTVLAGVELIAYKQGAPDTPLLVTTDSSGRFVADELDPGRYRLTAQRDGYITQQYGERARNREGILLRLAPAEKLSGVDFRLVPASVVTGHVFGEGNEPRVGTTVAAMSLHYVHGLQQLAIDNVTVTNDRGEYRLFGLRPDRYYLAAFEPNRHGPVRLPNGTPEERYGISFYPNALDAAKASVVNLQPGTELNGADIFLMRHRTFHVRGRVSFAAPNIQQSLVTLQPLLSTAAVTVGLLEISPDYRGVFDFPGVLPGQYLLSAAYSLNGKPYQAWQSIEVMESDVNGVSILPSGGISIQGRLQLADRKDVDLRVVSLKFRPTFSVGSGIPSPRLNGDGSFTAFVSADLYNLEISALPEDSYVESIRIADQDASDRVIDLAKFMGSSTRMEIALNPNGGRLDGVVQNENHDPVAGATVVLIPEPNYRKQSYLFRAADTDRNGTFTLRGIVPGDYKLLAWEDVEPGAWEDPEFLRNYEDRADKITIQPNGQESRNVPVIPAAVSQ